MTRRFAASSLIATFLLAGCGSQGLTSASSLNRSIAATGSSASASAVVSNNAAGIVANNAARLAPTVGLIRGQAAVVGSPELLSTLRFVGRETMADDEMAEDAQSAGYSLQAADFVKKSFNKTGFIRKTESGWMLEATKGSIFNREVDNYKLIAGTTSITTKFNERRDKKATITGLIDQGRVVTVTAVAGSLDLGFLTNWFTKGKIAGTTTDAVTKKALEGVTVTAKSTEGFVFSGLSDKDGEFTFKNLAPGKYTLKLEKTGYQGVASAAPEDVAKRDKVEFAAELAPVAAAE